MGIIIITCTLWVYCAAEMKALRVSQMVGVVVSAGWWVHAFTLYPGLAEGSRSEAFEGPPTNRLYASTNGTHGLDSQLELPLSTAGRLPHEEMVPPLLYIDQ